MVKSELENNVIPIVVMWVITLVSTAIVGGVLLNLFGGITNFYLYALLVVELGVVLLVVRQKQRKKKSQLS